MMVFFEIQDDKGRIVLRQNDKGKILLGRYEDLDEETKEFAIETFCELTNRKHTEVRKFMEFETDENAFCS